jgi:hypothetical protein
VTTIVLYAVMAFDLWLWEHPSLHGWFVKRPVIDRTRQVEFRSDYVNPTTGAPTPPLEVYKVIKPTHSSLSMRLLTAESGSQSSSGTKSSAPPTARTASAASTATNPD